jgi:dienelactone hydrolase
MRRALVLFLIVVAFGTTTPYSARGALVKQLLEYSYQNKQFKGYLVFEDTGTGKRQGMLVFPEWWGLNEYTKMRADQLAAMNYIVLAVDIYGDGRSTKDPKMAGQWSEAMKKSEQLRDYSVSAYNALSRQKRVDSQQIWAVGYCFGGTAALKLAYTGADLRGVVSFHGGLIAPQPEELGKLRTKLLMIQGADDPFVPPDAIRKVETTLDSGHKDWQVIFLSGTVHAFTNPAAGSNTATGSAYNPVSAERAWKYMKVFLEETEKKTNP